MKKITTKIECPNCGNPIDVNTLLYNQIEGKISKTYEERATKEQKKYDEKINAFEKEKQNFEVEKQALHKEIEQGIKKGLTSEKLSLKKNMKKALEEEHAAQIKSLNEELEEKSKKLIEFNKLKSKIARLQRDKDEIKETISAEYEEKLSDRLQDEKKKILKNEKTKIELKLSEKNYLIDQLKKQLQEAQRKMEQGSEQVQGEVQELCIEQWLAKKFPLDSITEIKKGMHGADCIQVVNTQRKENCGSIYYESKRTIKFQPRWIEKFKNDMREKNADIGIIVTRARPNDMNRMGIKNGVWICDYEEFKSLALILRESVIKISYVLSSQENKGEKMNMLHDYLISNEFKLQIEGIVEGFVQMQTDLEREKRSIQGAWKKREKQISKVLLNTNYLYSSIKAIVGNEIPDVKQLEFTVDEENQNDRKK